MSPTGTRLDPLVAFNFVISLVESPSLGAVISSVVTAVAGFTECTGLEGVLTTEEYMEGGQNGYVHKFPTRMTYSNITLRRGLMIDRSLWNWHHDYVLGKGTRRNGVIILRNQLGLPVKSWSFKRALPLRWVGPSLHASESKVAIESVEIMHEGLEVIL
jgi:phage tail-like protein